VIIDCAVYRDGVRVSSANPVRNPADVMKVVSDLTDGEFCWIAVDEPAPSGLRAVGEGLRLHRLAVDDLTEPHGRPHVRRDREHLLIAARSVAYADDDVTTRQVVMCLGDAFALTVQYGGSAVDAARSSLETDRTRLRHGPVAVAHAVLDALADGYDEVAAELEIDVEEVETSVFSDERSQDADRIYRLKREALEFRRAVQPLGEPLRRLARDLSPRQARPYYAELADRTHRVMDASQAVDSLLDNALAAHMAKLSVQQNDDMRKLTAGAALFAIPTAIAGIYGMNFRYMPELHAKAGYPVVLLVMAVVCGYAYYRFKRSGWL